MCESTVAVSEARANEAAAPPKPVSAGVIERTARSLQVLAPAAGGPSIQIAGVLAPAGVPPMQMVRPDRVIAG